MTQKHNLAELQHELNNAEAELAGIRRESSQLEVELQKRQEDLKRSKNSEREIQLDLEV